MTTRKNRGSFGYIAPELKPYVEVLGEDLAAKLFLELGGSQVYFAAKSPHSGELPKVVGVEKARELASIFGDGWGCYAKIPLGREWLVNLMARRGMTDNIIARTVRCDVATVRRLVKIDDRKRRLRHRLEPPGICAAIAAEVDLNEQTVRNALVAKVRKNGSKCVAEATFQRIMEAAERMGYKAKDIPPQPFQRPPVPMFEG